MGELTLWHFGLLAVTRVTMTRAPLLMGILGICEIVLVVKEDLTMWIV